MNCSETQFLTPLYLSGELDAMQMFDFELHLRRCAACTRELEAARQCDEWLRDAWHEESLGTDELRQRVRTEMAKTKRGRSIFGWPPSTLPIAASVLAAISLGIIIFLLGSRSPTVYAAARDDHYLEVVQGEARPWLETPDEIKEFVRAELGEADFLERFAPAGYQLKRALHCYLLNQRYVHIVYEGGGREVSLFVRRKDAGLPGAALEVVNGCPLHAASVKEFEVAGFQSGRYTVLIVSDLPRAESLQLAKAAAASFT
jgi:anti-sigma factor RsiW